MIVCPLIVPYLPSAKILLYLMPSISSSIKTYKNYLYGIKVLIGGYGC
jgi:hypothetical protein